MSKKKDRSSEPEVYHMKSYPVTIKICPGYEGHRPKNLSHEVCKHCGSIKYYHRNGNI